VEEYNLYEIRIYRKTPDEQICFTTPETAEAIDLHLSINKDNHGVLFHFKIQKNLTLTLR
jgi:hypothetical protein